MNKLRKHSKKGFTLVELIVVIVIIAILIAALTPAILGVIDRANISADEADARSIMMAASVAAMNQVPMAPLATGDDALIDAELTGGNLWTGLTVDINFEGAMAIGVTITGGGRSSNSAGRTVGSSAAGTSTMVGYAVS